MESFFASLEKELLADVKSDDPAQAQLEVFQWIEAVYNRRQLHSTLGYFSPCDFETMQGPGVPF